MTELFSDYDVKNVTVKNYSLQRVLPWNYEKIKRGLILQDIRIPSLQEFNKIPFVWIATQDMEILVEIDCKREQFKSYILSFKIKAGFITDLASIPSVGRILITRNNKRIIVGAVAHDILFATAEFDFDISNILFKGINDFYKMGFFTSNIVYLAVKTPFARKHYQTDFKEIRKAKKQINFSYSWR